MIANHLWQSTLLALVAAATLRLMPRTRAAIRHAIWTIASLKFLVPFAALVAAGGTLGGWLTIPGLSKTAAAAAMTTASHIAAPFTVASVATTSGSGNLSFLSWPFVLTGLWIAGAIALIGWRGAQQRRAIQLMRRGVVVTDGPIADALARLSRRLGVSTPVAILAMAGGVEPAVMRWARPVLLWPVGLEDRLSTPQLDAIVLHELAHVRRRDNLWAMLQTLVEVVFWFNPLVWWISAELVRERERACDDEVLACGVDAGAYAGGLLAVGRFTLPLSAPALAGVIGFPLTRRVEAIMNSRGITVKPVRVRGAALIGASMLVAAPMAAGAMQATPAAAVTPATAVTPAVVATPAVPAAVDVADAATEIATTALPARTARPARPILPHSVAPVDQTPRPVPAPTPSTPSPAPTPAAAVVSDAPAQSQDDIEFRRGAYDAETPGLVKPVVIRHAEPKYTMDTLREKLHGNVTLEVVVAADGTVARARVTQSLDPRLDEEALKAAKLWFFQPGVLDGTAVPVYVQLDMQFRIH